MNAETENDVEAEETGASGLGVRLAYVVFAITRFWIFFLLIPVASDTTIYFRYSVKSVDLGERAFRDYPIEYPPLAYWAMLTPRLATAERLTPETIGDDARVKRHYGWYRLLFRAQMLAFDVVALLLFTKLVRRVRPEFATVAVWAYVLATALFGHVLYDRMDIGLSVLLLLWLWLRLLVPANGDEGRVANVASYVVLGLGIAYKLVGVVAVPFVLLSDLNAGRGSLVWRSVWMLVLLAVTIASAAFPFLAHAPAAGTDTLGFLKYHGERGIEIESTYATGLMVAHAFGYPIEVEISYGSANLASTWSAWLTRLSPIVLFVVLAIQGLRALLRGRDYDRRAGDRAGAIAILMVLFLSKVLSAQYFVFGLPLALYVATTFRGSIRFGGIAMLTVLVAGLSTAVFPYLWFPYVHETGTSNYRPLVPGPPIPRRTFTPAVSIPTLPAPILPVPVPVLPGLHPLPCSLLVLRNALFAVLVLGILVGPRRWTDEAPLGDEGDSGD